MIETCFADVRYAVRWLRRSPGFALVAIASLALGIGFNTALFSVVDAALFRPLPVNRPDRLVDVFMQMPAAQGSMLVTSSYADFLDMRAKNQTLSDMIGYSGSIDAVKFGDQSRLAYGEVVTGNFFQMLGVRAAIGRTLLPEDDRPGAPRAVAISYGLWQRDFGGDPAILGRTATIHGQAYAIVGVIDRAYSGMSPLLKPELWTPVVWVDEVAPAGIQDMVPSPGNTRLERRGQRWLFVRGRLKNGETVERARANLDVVMQQLAAEYPKIDGDMRLAVVPTSSVRVNPMLDPYLTPVATGLMIAVGLVLLVACANVASMLLARASGRQKEIGIRLALGASRKRLVQQLVTETMVLSACGAAAGIALGWAIIRLVGSIKLPVPVPVGLDLRIDLRVLTFTAAVTIVAGAIAGLAPALRATRTDLVSDLKGDATTAIGRRRWALRDGLVAAQMAVTFVLLLTAGLLTRSIVAAQHMSLGFQPDGLVAVSTDVGLIGYDGARAKAFYDQVLQRIRAVPGLEQVALTDRQPLAINYNRSAIVLPDRDAADSKGTPIDNTAVSTNYFATLGVRIVAGRDFSATDTATSPKVAIVNEAFARKFWPNETAVGKHFRTRAMDGPEYEVVGVSADYKVNTVGEAATPYVHFAEPQRPDTGEVILARAAVDPTAFISTLRRTIQEIEPNAVFLDSQTMGAQVAVTLLPARLSAAAVVVVGIVAMALAAIGLYGVIAYSVARRTREIGLRIALGAETRSVVAMVMRQGLVLAGVGAAVGVVLAFGAAKAVSNALYGVSAADPVSWGLAIAVLFGVSALANLVPARRASQVDPSIALRTD